MPATVSHTTPSFPFGEEMAAQHAGGDYATRYKFYSLSRTCFGSKELDPQTGYYYYGARYYDPVISRWLSVDNLASHPNQVDKSPYAYAWNNPVYYTDPDGNCPWCIPVVLYLLETGAETALDYTLDVLIGELTGEKPTWTGVAINFAWNLIPGAGEANSIKKGARLFKAINKIVDRVGHIPGVKKLTREVRGNYEKFYEALMTGDKQKFSSALGNFGGKLFELRLAAIVDGVKRVGYRPPGFNGEIDLLIKRGEKTIFGEAKSGDFSKMTFDQFMSKKERRNQMNRLLNYAKEQSAEVEYFFKKGKVSQDIIQGLKKSGIKVNQM